jgi:glycopeptide antibiotics resistance protein
MHPEHRVVLLPPPRRSHLWLFALAWTTFAVYGSLVPLQYQAVSFADALERFRHLPPLWFGIGTRADWVANILLFIPLTFLWLGALACDRKGTAQAVAAALVLPAAIAGSIALEFTQIWFAGRTVSRNDIVAETIGAIVGTVLWFGVGEKAVAWLRSYSSQRSQSSQVNWLLQLYVVGFVVFSVLPLDLTISLTELYHKYKSGQVLLIPFSYHYASVADMVYQAFGDVMVFVPVGAWIALTQQHRARGRSPVALGAIGGGLIAAAIEFVQLLVISRFTDVTDIVLGTAGAGLGAWLVVISTREPAARHDAAERRSGVQRSLPWLAAIAGYSLFLVAGFCFPFDVTGDGSLVRARLDRFLYGVPFQALYQGTEFNAINQLLIRLLLFAPIGAMWARVAGLAGTTSGRRVLALAGVAYSVLLAFGIEALQVFMPSKVADLTEVALCVLGALGGLFLTSRLLTAGPRD